MGDLARALAALTLSLFAELSGTVTDSLTNAPMPHALVLLAGTTLEGTTNRAGRFTIRGVPAGQYVAEVRTVSLESVGVVTRVPIIVGDTPWSFMFACRTSDRSSPDSAAPPA